MNAIINNLLYAGLGKADFDKRICEAHAENRGKLKTYALVATGLFIALVIASLIPGSYTRASLWSNVVMALFSIAMYALAQVLPAKKPSATTVLCYLFIAAMYAFSLVDSALQSDLPAVVAIAVMLLGPFLFTERPLPLIAMNVVSIMLLCLISDRLKSPRLATIDTWNAVVFGVIAIAAELSQESLRFRLLQQACEIKYMSETDDLTKCKNRNCYNGRLPRFADMCKQHLVCVYIDVNGLHNLNDSQGHEAGDRMLKAVAQALLDAFGQENTYRIGGDEFVVILPDGAPERIRLELDGIVEALAKLGYDISVGEASAAKAGLNVEELIKSAEKVMYERKVEYYEDPAHERRRR